MSADNPIPPPTPPPIPPQSTPGASYPRPMEVPQPLVYATPIPPGYGPGPYGATPSTFYHQAAKASRAAPVVAFGLGFCTIGMRNEPGQSGMAMVIGVINLGLILLGFILAIVAFFGIKKYGTRGILANAIVGLCINGAFVGILVIGVGALVMRPRAAIIAPAARAAPAPVPYSSPQSAIRQTGWVGFLTAGSADLTLVAMDDAHVDTNYLRQTLRGDCSIVVVAIDNRRSASPITVKTNSAALHFSDGSVGAAIDATSLIDRARDGEAFFAKMTQPRTVPAGQMVEDAFILVPRGAAGPNLSSVVVDVDGRKVEIPGRIMQASQKTAAYEKSKASQSAP